jgi:hypothetical protein
MRFRTVFGYMPALLVFICVTTTPGLQAKPEKQQRHTTQKVQVEKHFSTKGQYIGKSVTRKTETKHYDNKGKYTGKSKSSAKKIEHYDSKGKKLGSSVKRQ